MTVLKPACRTALLALALGLAAWPMTANASDFTKALTKDYFELSRLEYYYSDDRFAVKARAADAGENVLPDDPDKMNVPAGELQELQESHTRLMNALNGGFRESAPQEASRAQTMYDCWLGAVIAAHGQAWKCIDRCRNGFIAAMAAWTPRAEAAPAAMAKPEPATAPQSFVVFFDWDRQAVTPDAERALEAVVSNAKARGITRIHLSGNADRSGTASYNMKLSLRRAEAVKAALVNLGVNATNITMVGLGESEPLVKTADGVREPRNRRVDVNF